MIGTIFLYNFILLGSTFFIYLSEKARSTEGRVFCTIIAFSIVFLPSAFRYYIGVDYHAYIHIYETIGLGHDSRVEIAYIYLNKILNYWNLEVEWLFAIMAFATYLIAFLSYPKKNKAVYHYLYLTTFYFLTFTSLRNMLASSFVLLAISIYLKNKKLLTYISLILIGVFFHKSVILLLIFPLIDTKKIQKIILNTRFLLMSLFILMFIFGLQIIEWMLTSPIAVAMGYDNYISSEYHIQKTRFGTGFGFLMRVFPLLALIIFYKKIIKANRDQFIYILVSLTCIVSVILSSQIHILTRFERIFALAYIYAPLTILYTKSLSIRHIIVGVIILFNLISYNYNYLTYTTQKCEGIRLSPYVSIFNKHDDDSLKVTAEYCQ